VLGVIGQRRASAEAWIGGSGSCLPLGSPANGEAGRPAARTSASREPSPSADLKWPQHCESRITFSHSRSISSSCRFVRTCLVRTQLRPRSSPAPALRERRRGCDDGPQAGKRVEQRRPREVPPKTCEEEHGGRVHDGRQRVGAQEAWRGRARICCARWSSTSPRR
jgi:hypothetical protein